MRLVEKPVPQSYHLSDNDWTPLSQNPCWICIVYIASNITWEEIEFALTTCECTRNSTARASITLSNTGSDTSFEDDLVASRYCKCWEWALSHDPLRFILCFLMCFLFKFNNRSYKLYNNILVHLHIIRMFPYTYVLMCPWIRELVMWYMISWLTYRILEHTYPRCRPYYHENTGSLSNSEVKRGKARLVLGSGTAWEPLRVPTTFSTCIENPLERTGSGKTKWASLLRTLSIIAFIYWIPFGVSIC